MLRIARSVLQIISTLIIIVGVAAYMNGSLDPRELLFLLPAWAANMAMSFGMYIEAPWSFFYKKVTGWPFSLLAGVFIGLIVSTWQAGCILSLAAMIGDIANSSVKRLFALPKGTPFLFFDETNYMIVALVIAPFITYMSPLTAAVALALSFLLHRPFCVLGYKMGTRYLPY